METYFAQKDGLPLPPPPRPPQTAPAPGPAAPARVAANTAAFDH
jgi:hypothetical protein